jgi:hypothetical protein
MSWVPNDSRSSGVESNQLSSQWFQELRCWVQSVEFPMIRRAPVLSPISWVPNDSRSSNVESNQLSSQWFESDVESNQLSSQWFQELQRTRLREANVESIVWSAALFVEPFAVILPYELQNFVWKKKTFGRPMLHLKTMCFLFINKLDLLFQIRTANFCFPELWFASRIGYFFRLIFGLFLKHFWDPITDYTHFSDISKRFD